MKDLSKLKYDTISNVYLYIQTKEDRYRDSAFQNLTDLAKAYHVRKQKVKAIDLNLALIQFLQNKNGMKNIINNLNSSL